VSTLLWGPPPPGPRYRPGYNTPDYSGAYITIIIIYFLLSTTLVYGAKVSYIYKAFGATCIVYGAKMSYIYKAFSATRIVYGAKMSYIYKAFSATRIVYGAKMSYIYKAFGATLIVYGAKVSYIYKAFGATWIAVKQRTGLPIVCHTYLVVDIVYRLQFNS
jgi:hypothetical protein